MEELANTTTALPVPEPPSKSNRGWFQRGDKRINREGRPRKTPLAPGCAKHADRLKLLVIPFDSLLWRLSRERAPWIINFPEDLRIVDTYFDPAGKAVTLVVRSGVFPEIARGSPIPKFTPSFYGRRWGREY